MNIHYTLFLADPTKKPPFNIELGIANDQVIVLENCLHIPDGVKRIKEYITETKSVLLPHFTLLYPIYMYAMNTEHESTMLSVAWLIKEEADKQQWNFDRVGGLSGRLPKHFIQ